METIKNFPKIDKKNFPLIDKKDFPLLENNFKSENSIMQDLKLILSNLKETLKPISKVCK